MKFDVIVSRPGFNQFERIGCGISAEDLGEFLSNHPGRDWTIHPHPSFWENTSFRAGDCNSKAGD